MTRTARALGASMLVLTLGGVAPASAQEPVTTTLTYTGATTAQHDADLAISATLTYPSTDPETGDPVQAGLEGKEITFTLHDADGLEVASAKATTIADGTAAGTIRLSFPVGDGYEVRASFAGDEGYLPSAAEPTPVSVTIAGSKLTYTGASGGIRGTTITLAARLQHVVTNDNLSGRTLRFSIPGLLDTTATTNSGGTASVSFPLTAVYGSYPLTVTWDGEEGYTGASRQQTITIAWTWTFISEQGLGTVYLNDTLNEFRILAPGIDSGIVTGAAIQNHTPQIATVTVVSASYASPTVSLELVGNGRQVTTIVEMVFEASGHVGTSPYAMYRLGLP